MSVWLDSSPRNGRSRNYSTVIQQQQKNCSMEMKNDREKKMLLHLIAQVDKSMAFFVAILLLFSHDKCHLLNYETFKRRWFEKRSNSILLPSRIEMVIESTYYILKKGRKKKQKKNPSEVAPYSLRSPLVHLMDEDGSVIVFESWRTPE